MRLHWFRKLRARIHWQSGVLRYALIAALTLTGCYREPLGDPGASEDPGIIEGTWVVFLGTGRGEERPVRLQVSFREEGVGTYGGRLVALDSTGTGPPVGESSRFEAVTLWTGANYEFEQHAVDLPQGANTITGTPATLDVTLSGTAGEDLWCGELAGVLWGADELILAGTFAALRAPINPVPNDGPTSCE